ncbi:hypothetical protein ACJU26_09110 [Acidithiobacillus sp. M4-SHS-6]|uniref:hypothetical protein n=1 Tax=Acidithiobacillus sp. M4-SHS-6 TaxID=3383024 RepID=UPI0039BE223D
MDYTQQVGFFLSKLWRFGPLYAFLPLAAQSLILDIPFTLEDSAGNVLMAYNGEEVTGNDEYLSLLEECIKVLNNDFVELIRTMQVMDIEFQEKEEAFEEYAREINGNNTNENPTKQ